MQGLTVKNPNTLVVDLRSVREPAQAYVILSRVQSLNQIFILESLCPDKITASKKAVLELERMHRVALNRVSSKKNSIVSCKIRSLNKNIKDLLLSTPIKTAKVICLQETWLQPWTEYINILDKSIWTQRNICIGRGRGITTLYQKEFVCQKEVKNEDFQITMIESDKLVIINL